MADHGAAAIRVREKAVPGADPLTALSNPAIARPVQAGRAGGRTGGLATEATTAEVAEDQQNEEDDDHDPEDAHVVVIPWSSIRKRPTVDEHGLSGLVHPVWVTSRRGARPTVTA